MKHAENSKLSNTNDGSHFLTVPVIAITVLW